MGNDWVVLALISRAFAYIFPLGNGNSHCPVKQKENTLPLTPIYIELFSVRSGEIQRTDYCGS